ncbi:MAG: tripartite tricarboxylate transporter substrate binding protein [Xanthobacteraceae bacterium]
MNFQRRRFLQLSATAAVLPILSRAARADDWPSRLIKLEVGFPPGGGADAAARIVANGLTERLDQQVFVENRPGAGGRVMLDSVAHAPPDGYTMMLAAGAPAVSGLLYSGLSYDSVADFTTVSLIGTYPSLLVVPNASPFAGLEDFIAFAKANPGKIGWASPGIGSVPHLAGELFKRMADIDITHVPYRGVAAGAMTDLIAGRLDAMFNTTGSLLQPVKSGQVRALAVTSAKRFPFAPEIPTIAQSGVPGYEAVSWYALYVPARTPADVVNKTNKICVAMLAETSLKEKFEPLGIVAGGSTPEQLDGMNAADAARWAPVIKAANIRGE